MSMKRFAPILAALIIVLGGAWYVSAHRADNDTTATASPTVSASATATATPQATTVTYAGVEGKTAMATLKSTHTVVTKTYSFGDSVESIDGLAADAGHYWAFYVNGQYASVGADAYTAKSGDMIDWKYEVLTQ